MFRPWGIVQTHCCGFSRISRKKFVKTFPIIPFTGYSNPDDKNHHSRDILSLAEQNRLRIDSLELFLQEYIIDVNYLNGIRSGNPISSREVSSNPTLNFTENTRNNFNNDQIIEEKDLIIT